MIPMSDTTGGKGRKMEITLRFGGTEIIMNGKDLTTGADVQAVFDFLWINYIIIKKLSILQFND